MARAGFSSEVLDRCRSDRHVGSLPDESASVGSASVEGRECGDMLKLQIEVDESSGRIERARFRAFGCAAAIASASLVAERLEGRSLDAALSMTAAETAGRLDLPPAKRHAARLAIEAVGVAVADYHGKARRREQPGEAASARQPPRVGSANRKVQT